MSRSNGLQQASITHVQQLQHRMNDAYSPYRQPRPLCFEAQRKAAWSAPQPLRDQKVFVRSDSMKRLRMDGALCKSDSAKSLRIDDGSATATTPRLRAGLLQKNQGFKLDDSSNQRNGPRIRAGLLQKNGAFYISDTTATIATTTVKTDPTTAVASPTKSTHVADIVLDPCQFHTSPMSPFFDAAKCFKAKTTDSTVTSSGLNTVSTASMSTWSHPSSPSTLPVLPLLNEQRKVRFDLNENDAATTATTLIGTKSLDDSMHLTGDEVKSMWWTKEEQKDMKRRARSAATRVLACTQDFRLAVEQLLLHCYHYHDQGGTTSRETPFSHDDAVRITVNHGARGKEQIMINAFNLETCRFYYKCDKVNVQRVLAAQATATSWFKATSLSCLSTADKERVAEVIALEQGKYSAFAAHFARLLAEGDAHAAAGRYDTAFVRPLSYADTSTWISDDDMDEYDEALEDSRVIFGRELFTV